MYVHDDTFHWVNNIKSPDLYAYETEAYNYSIKVLLNIYKTWENFSDKHIIKVLIKKSNILSQHYYLVTNVTDR